MFRIYQMISSNQSLQIIIQAKNKMQQYIVRQIVLTKFSFLPTVFRTNCTNVIF